LRRQLTAYLSEEEYQRLRDEADQRGITLSRHVKELLFESNRKPGHSISQAALIALEKRLIDGNRSSTADVLKPIAEQLTAALAMIDQFVLSVLSHLPEIPEEHRKQALASGQRRYEGWRAEVEEILAKAGQQIRSNRAPLNSNGASA